MRFEWVVALGILVAGCAREKAVLVDGEAMGMRWRVQVVGGNARGIEEVVTRVMGDWEMATSLWRNDSELAEFNRAPEGQWIRLGDKLWSAVALVRGINRETDGALDITVGPLINLWGFGSKGRLESEPSEFDVQVVMQRCGMEHLEFDDQGHLMRKLRVGMEVNVNCVVEGLALENLASELRAAGHGDFLLELGGELLAEGYAAEGRPWMVAVEIPGGYAGDSFSMMPLSGLSLATSGTYRHRFVKNGMEVSHLIDPWTGHPVAHCLTSVSVVDANCGRADGFATALLVLGSKRGREVAERLGLRVIWIETTE